ncbi:hatching enzyme 1.2-like [Myxocyprinus asiaticus]|uniref:hatching enzyme 1.2-like n=1 Tax=Myxocyprinus asiaticus TaxID=70543 RepID=UPI002221CE39|nr:hatching enzyme 1.2-like [Myxocyprinus asiaticus]
MDHVFLFSILALLLNLSQARPAMVLTNNQNIHSEKHDEKDISSQILEANKEISHSLLEGDLAMPKTKNAMKCLKNYCRWPKNTSGLVEVPYTISASYDNNTKMMIVSAMKSIANKTCIRFVPQSNQTDYISIESLTGCWSYLGRIGGKQSISISVSGCVNHGIIEHELLHSLGFYHEHTRSDRGQYVRINWENIAPASVSNFELKDTNNLNTTYDYTSIMHYGRTSFTIQSGKETITPIPDSSVKIGQRVEMSTIDILRINKLYECAAGRLSGY